MKSYICIEVNTLHRRVIKAKNPKEAFEALERQLGPIKNPRLSSHSRNKEVYIHYNKGP